MQTLTPTIELNINYAIPSETTGATYPALQVSQYKFLGKNDKLSLVLSPESLELMDLDQAQLMGLTPKTCTYYDQHDKATEVEMLEVPSTVRWVILHRPSTGYVNSPNGVRRIQQGDKFKEMGLKSVARVFLAAVIDGQLVLNHEGTPQIFTWKLNSSKCQLIVDRDKDKKTMTKLNDALCAVYKLPTNNWLTHLCSIEIRTFPAIFQNSEASSIGPNFEIVGDAIRLTPDQQKLTYELAVSDDFKVLCADPFGLAKRNSPPAEQQLASGDSHPGYELSDINF